MRGFFERQINVTAKVMDLQLQRQNIVTSNIANVNTPGYKARRLEFEEKMQDALNENALGKMTRTSQAHMPTSFSPDGFSGESFQNMKAREIYGQDSVDLDTEMAASAKTSMIYNALASIIKKDFDGIGKAIMEGSK